MRKLTTGEWRLFLLSDCIKWFGDVAEHTQALRKAGKGHVLHIDGNDSKELDDFISEEDATKIRAMLRKEWRFTGKVLDNGKGRKSTCEYCQKQKIRYKFLCHNDKTGQWLALGSVCVGYVIHGEDKMKDEKFAKKFVEDLERYKNSNNSDNGTKATMEDIRESQKPMLAMYLQYLRQHGKTAENNNFIASLQDRWKNGLAITDKQMDVLISMCKKIKYSKSKLG